MENKWYRSAPCKGILIVLEHIFAAAMAVCFVWTLVYFQGNNVNEFFEKPEKNYADSGKFEDRFQQMASGVVWAVPKKDNYMKDGEVDRDKIVDLKEYYYENTISGENASGLAYHLGDLLDWGNMAVTYSDYGDSSSNIVVGKKEYGTYQYFWADDFRKAVADGELTFGNANVAKENYELKSNLEIADALLEGWDSSDVIFSNILAKSEDGDTYKMLYTKCWLYDGGMIEEAAEPIGGKSLLDIVNTQPEWNGKLEKAVDYLCHAVTSIQNEIPALKNEESVWEEGNTNAVYLIVDQETGKVYTNRGEYKNAEDWKKNIEAIKTFKKYVVVTPKLKNFESNLKGSANDWRELIGANMWTDEYICAFAVDTSYPIQDVFYQESKIYSTYAPFVRQIFALGLVTGMLTLAGLVWLTIVSGRSNREEGICLMVFDRIKTEIFLVFSGGLFCLACVAGYEAIWQIANNGYYSYYNEELPYGFVAVQNTKGDVVGLILVGGAAMLICASGLILWLGMARRLKAHTVWRNSVLRWMGGFVKNVLSHMNIIWKAVLAFAGFVLIHWIVMVTMAASSVAEYFFIMLVVEGLAFIYLINNVIGKNKIKRGVQAIASGQVDYQIPLKGLKGEQLELAQGINMIGDGLDRALEESMKNERLKTDLITNVSHDIKTPLTSIINYVELLKRENFEDPKIQNYIKVLEEKAQRLKTLTEDVVEASKVSSGNIKFENINLNFVELINQTSAEFEEKFKARNLKLIANIPDEPVTIYADGRRMWRVLANIFNNAAKYAMEGSRVYADLKQTENEILFTLKNVSEQPLNISAEELTERFIRGDVSRSTEGSGLGLSIAQNLTRLQGGSFELYLDGDLFKVEIRFPR